MKLLGFTILGVILHSVTVTPVSGQGRATFSLTPLDNSHLTTSLRMDCSFLYTDSVSIVQSAQFYRKRETEPNFSQVARVEVGPTPVYSWNDTALQARSTLTLINRTFVRMEVSNIGCNDKAQYRCTYYVRDRENEYYISGEDQQLVVTAPPGKPQITYSPNMILENEPVTFTCSGNVGLPAGTLGILVVKSDGQEVNLNANNGLMEVELNDCTFRRTAVAQYHFKEEDDGRTRVRCKVQQTYANDVDHSVQTAFLSVLYAGLGKTCNGHLDCEAAGSSCKPQGCSGYRCQCGVGYMEVHGRCFNASIIGESCSADVKCRPKDSVCTNGVCSCPTGYVATRDNYLCIPSSQFRRLGENCDTGVCLMTQCVNSVCICNNGEIPWTEELKWLIYTTTTVIDCHPPEMSNEFCNGTNITKSFDTTVASVLLGSTTEEPPSTSITSPRAIARATTVPLANSSAIPHRSDIQCGSVNISVDIPLSLLGDGYFTLQDPQCTLLSSNGRLTTQFGLTECGTTAHFTDDAIVYKNFINNHPDGMQSVEIACEYPRRKNLSMSYRPVQRHVRFYEKNFGTMDMTMRQFTSENFTKEIPPASYPVNVKVDEPVYIQVEVTSLNRSTLTVFPTSCIVTNSSSPHDSTTSRHLLRNGCKVDSSVVAIYPVNDGQLRFSFNAFTFTSNTSVVYIHCEILLCNARDLASECSNGCNDPSGTRARRSAATAARDGHFVSGGPFVLDNKSSTTDSSLVAVMVAVATISIVIAMVSVIVAVAFVRGKRAKNRNDEN